VTVNLCPAPSPTVSTWWMTPPNPSPCSGQATFDVASQVTHTSQPMTRRHLPVAHGVAQIQLRAVSLACVLGSIGRPATTTEVHRQPRATPSSNAQVVSCG
jgi:hypothetical protein